MNKEELMNKVVEWTSTTAQQIGDFASKEIPPFIHEYLMWKFWENAIQVVFYFLVVVFYAAILVCLYKLSRFLWKQYKLDEEVNTSSIEDFPAYLSIVVTIVGTIALFIAGALNFPTNNIMECVQIKLAPKVYLVEKASQIYNSNK